MERLFKKKGSVESLQQLIAYSKNQIGIPSTQSTNNQKHLKEMLSQSGSNTKIQQQASINQNQAINSNNNCHSNNMNLLHQLQLQQQQFPINDYNQEETSELFKQNENNLNNLFGNQVIPTINGNNSKKNVKSQPMQSNFHSTTVGQSQIVGRKKSQGVLQNNNNQNVHNLNHHNINNQENNNHIANTNKHNEKNQLMDFLTNNQHHHQQLLYIENQKGQNNLNNVSNQQSPIECQSGSKNRNESSGHDGSIAQNLKLNNLIHQLTKQSQMNSQFQDGASPSKIQDEVLNSNNKPTKKLKQQQQVGVNQKEKFKNTMHSYSNSLTNQKNKSSSCSSQQHLLQTQQFQPNPLQSLSGQIIQKQENPDNQYQNQQQQYGTGAISQSNLESNVINLNQQQMGYSSNNNLQQQQPYITDQIHKVLSGKSLVSSSQSSQSQPQKQHAHSQIIQQNQSLQQVQLNQQQLANYQQHNLKQNDYYEVNSKVDKEKNNLKKIRNGCSTQQNQASSPQSQTNATATTLLQNSNHTSSINFASSNGNHLSNTFSTTSNQLNYNSPQTNVSGKQSSQNTSQNGKKQEKNKTKKQLTINTAEVHQTYNFPSNLQIPHTTNTTTNKNQLQATNDENMNQLQLQWHIQKQMLQLSSNNAAYNQYIQQSQLHPDFLSTKNSVNVQSQQLYLQSGQIQQLLSLQQNLNQHLSQQQLLNQQQHQQSQFQQSNLQQSSNLSSCNRPKTAKNSASSSSNKQNFVLNSSKSKQQQNVPSSSSSSIMKQLSPKYQQQLIKYEGMNNLLHQQSDNILKENFFNHIGKQNEMNNIHEINMQEPFFLSPKHPKSQPQSTKNQSKQTHFEFPTSQQQQQPQQQINNYISCNQNEQVNLSQTLNQSKQLQKPKNLQINNLQLQQQQQHQPSLTSNGKSQSSQMLTNKKFSSSREVQDLKSNSNLKQSSTRDTSIQTLQRTDLIKIVQRTSQILNSYSKQREFWMQEKRMLLNEVNQLRTRLQFYEDNTQ